MSIRFWHIALAVVGISGATACAGGESAFPPPKTADEYFASIQGDSRVAPIRVFVLEPKIENDTWAQEDVPRVIREQLVTALKRIGFTVVAKPLDPRDLDAQLRFSFHKNEEPRVTFHVDLLRNGRVEDSISLQDATLQYGDMDLLEKQRRAYALMFSKASGAILESKVVAALLQKGSDAPSAPATPGAPPQPRTPEFIAAAPQPQSFALVIGIDRYRDIPAAPGARLDAERFATLVRRTLGLREEHVRVALDDHATRQDIQRGLSWLKDNASAGGRVYFFFSGHGAPSTSQSTYLMPFDSDAKDIGATGLSLAAVMQSLGETKAKETLAIVDACFSGAGGRSVLPPGARPLMRVKEEAPAPQMAVFTASQADEISGPAPDENAGLFTRYVTQGLGTGQADVNGDGQVSLQELSDWVGPRVAREAKKSNREQHPNLTVGAGVGGAANFIVAYGIGK